MEQALCTRLAALIAAYRTAQCPQRRPHIGLFAPSAVVREGAWQVYALDQPIADAIFAAGGFPLGLPGLPFVRGLDTFEVLADADAFRAVFDALWPTLLHLDGLLLPGGGDLDARLYGRTPHPQLQDPDPWVDLQQLLAALIAWAIYLPTFGICRGMQVMNVARGGSLFQDDQELRQRWGRPLLQHRKGRPSRKNLITHPLLIQQGGWLAQVARGRGDHRPPRYHLDAVLSMHHNFIDKLAPGLRVEGVAPDGVTEAFGDEDPLRVYSAVQFHPEYVTSLEWAMGIFIYHVEASAQYAALPRDELEPFRDEVYAWLWRTISQRFASGEQGHNGSAEEVMTGAVQEMQPVGA